MRHIRRLARGSKGASIRGELRAPRPRQHRPRSTWSRRNAQLVAPRPASSIMPGCPIVAQANAAAGRAAGRRDLDQRFPACRRTRTIEPSSSTSPVAVAQAQSRSCGRSEQGNRVAGPSPVITRDGGGRVAGVVGRARMTRSTEAARVSSRRTFLISRARFNQPSEQDNTVAPIGQRLGPGGAGSEARPSAAHLVGSRGIDLDPWRPRRCGSCSFFDDCCGCSAPPDQLLLGCRSFAAPVPPSRRPLEVNTTELAVRGRWGRAARPKAAPHGTVMQPACGGRGSTRWDRPLGGGARSSRP